MKNPVSFLTAPGGGLRAFNRRSISISCCLSAIALLAIVAVFVSSDLVTRSFSSELCPARIAASGGRVALQVNCRNSPFRVRPVAECPHLVTEDDLVSVLCNALPMWNPPAVPSLYHELNLWGKDAAFTYEMIGSQRSGKGILGIILSDTSCRRETVQVGGAYLLESPFGARVSLLGTKDGVEARGEAHFGQLLKVLAQSGVASSTPVEVAGGENFTVADLYQDVLMEFNWNRELEFFAIAVALYQEPSCSWKDKFNNEYSFDLLLEHLLRKPLGSGSCGGCHLPYAITTILRLDEKEHVLSEAVRLKGRNWLSDLSLHLTRNQDARGGWNQHWANASNPVFINGNDQMDAITVTGHHLEWIALAPPDLRPEEATVRAAVLALRREVESLPILGFRSFKTLLPISHAGRALALLRGDDPFTKWCEYWKSGKIVRNGSGVKIRS